MGIPSNIARLAYQNPTALLPKLNVVLMLRGLGTHYSTQMLSGVVNTTIERGNSTTDKDTKIWHEKVTSSFAKQIGGQLASDSTSGLIGNSRLDRSVN